VAVAPVMLNRPVRHRQGRKPAYDRGPAVSRLLATPRVTLGHWPTPVDLVSDAEAGDVLVKRDDLCGFGRGGSKARKLEHLLGHMRARDYDELIVVTGNVSNLVFDLVLAIEPLGLPVQILVANHPLVDPRERDWIFRDLLDRVRLLGASPSGVFAAALATWHRSRARGRRPLLLLPGAAHPAAVLGNARGFIEMAAQLQARGEPLPGAVFVTAATGTTVAGFRLAAHALACDGAPPIDVIGVRVDHAPVGFLALQLIRWTERMIGVGSPVPGIDVVPTIGNAAFARYSPEVEALCARVRHTHGIPLDPIFGGKTWAVMRRSRRSGRCPHDKPAMFWHCGYTPGWPALATAVRRGAPGPC
jgi:1-aminocyclopropane-1-carboxylate deaminase/D-cysteine desulfhydrase-like pyridoxal-dependent ACC family enzyme